MGLFDNFWGAPKKAPAKKAPAKKAPAKKSSVAPQHGTSWMYNPGTIRDMATAESTGLSLTSANRFNSHLDAMERSSAPASPPRRPSGGSGGGGRGYSYGGGGRGGGGGGGGPSAAQLAQGQLDYLMKLLGTNQWKATPDQAARDAVNKATASDLAAASGSYDVLDRWLAANQRNPYNDVRLQRAGVANEGSAYLTTQGAAPLQSVSANPDDAYGGFQNVLQLLGANFAGGLQSRGAESQMARTGSTNMINAVDNGLLAQIAAREAQRQQALDDQKRQVLVELAALVGQGAKAPDLAKLGLA